MKKNTGVVLVFIALVMILTIAIYYTQSDKAFMTLFYSGIIISIIIMIFAIVQRGKNNNS